MKEKVELSKVREFGDIISDSFIIVRQNFKPLIISYLVICGMFIITGVLVTVVANTQEAIEGSWSIFSFWGFVGLLFQLIEYTAVMLTTISYLAIYKQKNKQPPTVLEVWEYFKFYFFRVFGAQVVLTIGLGLGILLCFFPGIYLSPVFALVIPIMVVENTNLEYAIRKAFRIIKENWGFTFGVILLLSIIVGMALMIVFIPAIILYSGGQWLTGSKFDSTFSVMQAIIIHGGQILWLLPIIGVTLVYYSLAEHTEGTSLVNRIKMFGKNDSPTDQFPTDQY
ncbi:hypothetical protein [Mucilaginibacter sp. FT3.2]|uniref:hypothetical protein n=1 Tax=Mucilaginibacter sp. FT3.2 TaxID=2723090 RepID=UPI0016101D14|nr:hypothetical protein [Mucilaginibacter sp. FT3.2]MBB6234474.1 hypothetical protein [Mucilaginibacter sp. FT3.2]